MDMHKFLRSGASVLGVAGLVAVGAVVGGTPAGAASMGGRLGIHAAGSIYAGSNAIIAVPTAPGGVATFSIAVFNKGTSLAQFNVQLFVPAGVTATLSSGTLITTPLATSEDGYFTKPIAPGKAEILTLKATTPAGASKHDQFIGFVQLLSTNGVYLDAVEFINTVKATVGANTNDLVTTAPGSAAVVAEPDNPSLTTAEPIRTGGAAVYTVKFQNDGPAPAVIHGLLSRAGACPNPYQLVAKVGSVAVPPALLAGTFVTPTLAHGKFTTVVITVHGSAANGCLQEEDDVLADFGTNGESAAALITNVAG
jgi:hypothetical protein